MKSKRQASKLFLQNNVKIQAEQVKRENEVLRNKVAELEEQLKKEIKMRQATDVAFKTETRRLRDMNRQLKKGSRLSQSSGLTNGDSGRKSSKKLGSSSENKNNSDYALSILYAAYNFLEHTFVIFEPS